MFHLGVHMLVLCALLLVASTQASPALFSSSPSLSALSLEARDTSSASNSSLNNVDGSNIFKQCVQRYNTQRIKPLPPQGYFDPNKGNGSQITIWLDGTPGEPMNVIISSNSSSQVLCPEGFLRYATSINFGVSCLGNTNGTDQYANLGDGFGIRQQGNYGGGNGVLRWNYGDLTFGTCRESIEGNNHFRWFLQNGTEQFTGAIFIAASMEESAALGHMIQINGYNRGRDNLVKAATENATTSYQGYVWKTEVEYIPAGVLLNATSEGINHPQVALPGQPVQDGRVALLTVTLLEEPASTSAAPALRPWLRAGVLMALFAGALSVLM